MRKRAAGTDRARRLRGAIAVMVLSVVSITSALPAVAAASPDWVESGGRASRYPAERYVTGYGQARGRDAEVRARQAAMAALAQAIHVRVEFELEDDRREGDGRYDASVAALTRTTSELDLQGVRFEIHRGSRRVHALAIIEREAAGARRRSLRDRALVRAEACLADAELTRESGAADLAERQLARCRAVHAEALRHDAVSTALGAGSADAATGVRLERVVQALDQAERDNAAAPARSVGDAADRLAVQLVAQGLARPRRLDLEPLADSSTDLPSPFGQVMAVELERALAKAWSGEMRERRDPRRFQVEGTHLESGDEIRLTVIAREFGTGTLLASAATTLPRDAVPDGVALRPDNWEPALAQRERLAAVPAPAPVKEPAVVTAPPPKRAALRVELWTDRGRDRVSYTEGEAIRVFLRVNGPAWVRLVYVLSNGLTVPIEESLHVDADRAHTAIAYPGRLEVVAPFGVEMLHAAAFDSPPAPLATRLVTVAGERYEVIDEGVDALVRARGVRLRLGESVAEDVVTITTLASAGAAELRPREHH